MTRLLTFIPFFVVVSCSDQISTEPIPHEILHSSFVIPFSDGTFNLEMEEIANASSKDYSDAVKAASKMSEEGLSRVFRISANSPWDAAGGEFHYSTMRQLLVLWGDHRYAEVLSREEKRVRQDVYNTLRWSNEEALKLHFPHTTAVGTKK